MKHLARLKLPINVPLIAISCIAISFAFYNIGNSQISIFPKQYLASTATSTPQENALMTGFEFTEYNAKDKAFTLKAKKFYLRNKKVKPFGFRIAFGKSAEMEDVKVIFYKDNKPISHLYSHTAIMDQKNKNIVFKDNPALVTKDGRTLSARKIIWNSFKKRLEAKGGCILGADGKRRSADKINTDVELRSFTVIGEGKSKSLSRLFNSIK